jgi:hypothetical protein
VNEADPRECVLYKPPEIGGPCNATTGTKLRCRLAGLPYALDVPKDQRDSEWPRRFGDNGRIMPFMHLFEAASQLERLEFGSYFERCDRNISARPDRANWLRTC